MPQKTWNPGDYDHQSVLQYNTAMSMLDSFLLEGNERILDVGCGTGKISDQIAQKRVPFGRVHGIDINKNMINFAKSKYKSQNLVFECCDLLTIKYSNCFDLVCSFWTLSWIAMKDQQRAILNIIESLSENGRLLLMYPLKHDAYTVVEEVIKWPRWEKYFINYSMPRNFITENQYRELIIKRIPEDVMQIDVIKKEIECRYKDEEEMISSINCWLAHVDEIPFEDEKKEFLSDVARSYKEYRCIDHPTMYYSTLEITGTKINLEYQSSMLCRL